MPAGSDVTVPAPVPPTVRSRAKSSSRIVPVACPRRTPAFTASDNTTENALFGSARASPNTETTILPGRSARSQLEHSRGKDVVRPGDSRAVDGAPAHADRPRARPTQRNREARQPTTATPFSHTGVRHRERQEVLDLLRQPVPRRVIRVPDDGFRIPHLRRGGSASRSCTGRLAGARWPDAEARTAVVASKPQTGAFKSKSVCYAVRADALLRARAPSDG